MLPSRLAGMSACLHYSIARAQYCQSSQRCDRNVFSSVMERINPILHYKKRLKFCVKNQKAPKLQRITNAYKYQEEPLLAAELE